MGILFSIVWIWYKVAASYLSNAIRTPPQFVQMQSKDTTSINSRMQSEKLLTSLAEVEKLFFEVRRDQKIEMHL